MKTPLSSTPLNRRHFLRTSAFAASAAAIGAPAFLRGQNLNSKLNIGIIGCGGRGGFAVSGAKNENIVALCDINEERLDKICAAHPTARRYVDFRKLLAEAKDIDAICVATGGAHARVRHAVGVAAKEACVLREAADALDRRGAGDRQGRGGGEGGHADGNAESRELELPPGR